MSQITWEAGHPDHSPNVPVGYYSEAQFTSVRDDLPHPEYWHTYDAQATEVEVIDFAWGLVRMLQPERVVETGTSRGFLASAIGQALKKNGHGLLMTYEPDAATHAEAVKNTAHVRDQVECWQRPSLPPSITWGQKIDLFWFDSLLTLRYPEFQAYYENGNVGMRTIMCFHDTARHFGEWSEAVRTDQRLAVLNMPTPRGLIVAQAVA